MVKTRTKAAISFIGVLSVTAGLFAGTMVARQAMAACPEGSTCAANTTFQVNVVESLTVELTTPQTWASGGIGDFLRNDVGLSVTSNNAKGFTASMYSQGGTDLNNTAKASLTLPTMENSETRGNFTANHWGYSLAGATGASDDPAAGYTETDAGNADSTYYPMTESTTAPTTVLYSNAAASKEQTIYFGAKANATQASGTYAGTVVISVVTGDVNENTNPVTPVNPATPGDDTPNDYTGGANSSGIATYNSGAGRTVYTTTSTDDTSTPATTTTRTEVSSGDTTSSYRAPAGVTTSSNGATNGAIIAALATTAGVAAVSSGFFFLILAKRRRDDDDEEDEQA